MLPELDECHSSADKEKFFTPLTSAIDLNTFFLKREIGFKIENVNQNSIKKRSAYETFHPDFVETMDKDDASRDNIKELTQSKISEMRVAVHSKLKDGVVTSSASGFSSLPSVKKCSVRKRLAPSSLLSSFRK